MNIKSDRLLSLQIAGLQGFYWMIFCPIVSFASVYLLSKDFSNGLIGWVMAISSVLAIVFQPALGTILDKTKSITLKGVLGLLSIISVGLLLALIYLDTGPLWMAVFYVGIVALLFTMPPLVNALTFEYINVGRDVNFGITRAMGSICFAILSLQLGNWINRFSTDILPITCMVLFAGFLLLLVSLPRVNKEPGNHAVSEFHATLQDKSIKTSFLLRYERFIPFLLGIACLFLFHTVINTFLAQILTPLGGLDSDLGISLTIAAVAELPAFLGFSTIVSKINTRLLIKFSGVFYLLRSLVFLFASSIWMINVGQGLQALSFAVFIPASVYYINEIMRDDDKVKGQTYVTGTATLGSFFGSVIGGWLLDRSGVPAMLVFGTAGAAAGCLMLFYAIQKKKITPQETQTAAV